jgi:hypothetical protein
MNRSDKKIVPYCFSKLFNPKVWPGTVVGEWTRYSMQAAPVPWPNKVTCKYLNKISRNVINVSGDLDRVGLWSDIS